MKALDLQALAERSDSKGIVQLLGHVGLLVITGWVVWMAVGTVWQIPAMAVHGMALVFLFAPLHETIHRTAFRTPWLNDGVAVICGLVLLLPPHYFRAFHFAHHRHTQDARRDPELLSPKPATRGQYLWLVSGIPYWFERITTIYRHAIDRMSEPFVSAPRRSGVATEARLFLLFYATIVGLSLYTGSSTAISYWLLPVLLGQPFLRLFLLAEHTGCPLDPNSFKNSRTTESNRFVRWISWNMPYHAAHHAFPALPFHALPQAHEALRDQLAVQSRSYFDVHRQITSSLATNGSSSR